MQPRNAILTRRDLLLGGATLIGAGGLLAGCGGGNGELKDSPPIPAGTRMLVSTFLNQTIEGYQATNENYVGTFLPSQGKDTTGNTITVAGLVRGAGNNLFAFSPGSNQILMLDVNTGQITRKITGLFTPHNGAIGPDGMLYSVNAPSLNNNVGVGPDTIERFDATTGDHLGTFAKVTAPFGIAWGPDGKLYVSTVLGYNPLLPANDYISRYNADGTFDGFLVRNILVPFNITFHPDGFLLVTDHFFGRVNMYELGTGRLKDSIADVPYVVGLRFGPDGHLYAASFTDDPGIRKVFGGDIAGALGAGYVAKFDGKNGKPLGKVVTGMPFAGYIAFV